MSTDLSIDAKPLREPGPQALSGSYDVVTGCNITEPIVALILEKCAKPNSESELYAIVKDIIFNDKTKDLALILRCAGKVCLPVLMGAFHLASSYGKTEALASILEKSAGRVSTGSIWSELQYEIMSGDTKSMPVILEKCSDRLGSKLLSKVLCTAAAYGSADTVSIVVKECATKLGSTAFTWALQDATYNKNKGEILNFLVKNVTKDFCGKDIVREYIDHGEVDKITPSLIEEECDTFNVVPLLCSIATVVGVGSIVYCIAKKLKNIGSDYLQGAPTPPTAAPAPPLPSWWDDSGADSSTLIPPCGHYGYDGSGADSSATLRSGGGDDFE